MRPLILITNDDSIRAKGLEVLIDSVSEFGDIVVISSEQNSSGKSHSLTSGVPLRLKNISKEKGLEKYVCNGTPVDCVKLGEQFLEGRKIDIVLSGINHGSNASINVIYSGTMGAVVEASINGYNAIGFSLLSENPNANFSACVPFVKHIVRDVLENGLPEGVSLNVNIPNRPLEEIKGIKVCRQSKALWKDSYEKRTDPSGSDYWWLTGYFACDDKANDTDIYALENGWVSVVPTSPDFTNYSQIKNIQQRFDK